MKACKDGPFLSLLWTDKPLIIMILAWGKKENFTGAQRLGNRREPPGQCTRLMSTITRPISIRCHHSTRLNLLDSAGCRYAFLQNWPSRPRRLPSPRANALLHLGNRHVVVTMGMLQQSGAPRLAQQKLAQEQGTEASADSVVAAARCRRDFGVLWRLLATRLFPGPHRLD